MGIWFFLQSMHGIWEFRLTQGCMDTYCTARPWLAATLVRVYWLHQSYKPGGKRSKGSNPIPTIKYTSLKTQLSTLIIPCHFWYNIISDFSSSHTSVLCRSGTSFPIRRFFLHLVACLPHASYCPMDDDVASKAKWHSGLQDSMQNLGCSIRKASIGPPTG